MDIDHGMAGECKTTGFCLTPSQCSWVWLASGPKGKPLGDTHCLPVLILRSANSSLFLQILHSIVMNITNGASLLCS